ncbi:MAG: 16S rRNA (cytosine(1402)-N(4))-methyltransferase RsmH [Candidatus Uhrbacteria bacterium]|nr:16S rRNA (cytosine(1402)-N(4))-methyltransferase RsmH [Candidatus Uhrbacteria bacterium]
MNHIPVLAKEVIAGLELKPGNRVLDGTVGLGGHASLMLEAISPDGTLVGFDRDARNLAMAHDELERFGNRVELINDSFGNLAAHATGEFDAELFDLGFSSVHVDDASRGFSFQHDGPLDMRYDTRQALTAEDVVNSWSRDDLATVFRRYGEEPKAPQAAKAIFDARREQRITTTLQLADIIAAVIPRRGKMHPATLVFQALRIVVNDELGEIERGLAAAIAALKPGGRIAVITFHSLEDRLVKTTFREHGHVQLITKKPLTASREEAKANPRARSAKLRVAQKIAM